MADLGLLGIEDPQQLGLLSLGLRLMSTPGRPGTALGQSGLGALGDMQWAKQAQQKAAMLKMQMDDMKAQQLLHEQQTLLAAQKAKREQEKIDFWKQQSGQGDGVPVVSAPSGLPSLMTNSGMNTPEQNYASQNAINATLKQSAPVNSLGFTRQQLAVLGGIDTGMLPTQAWNALELNTKGWNTPAGSYQNYPGQKPKYMGDPKEGLTVGPDGSVQFMPNAETTLAKRVVATKGPEEYIKALTSLGPADVKTGEQRSLAQTLGLDPATFGLGVAPQDTIPASKWKQEVQDPGTTFSSPALKAMLLNRATQSPVRGGVQSQLTPSEKVQQEGSVDYAKSMATAIAATDKGLYEQAQKAPDVAQRAIEIKSLLNNSDPITGIGADIRLGGAKILSYFGVKASGDTARDTETVMSLMAQTTLDMIRVSGLGGGNGFSNQDREFLALATGGKITYEKGNLLRLADLQYRAAEQSAKKWNNRAERIPKTVIESTGLDTTPIQVPPLEASSKITGPRLAKPKFLGFE